MKKLFLHIGSNKTGTTTLQNTMASNRKALERQGFCYPSLRPSHHFLHLKTQVVKEQWPRGFKSMDSAHLQKKSEKFFRRLEYDLKRFFRFYVLSTEYLFCDQQQAIDHVLDYLYCFVDEIEVLIYVRDPVAHYVSSQQQQIKASGILIHPNLYRYDFRSVISKYEARLKIHVIAYREGSDSLLSFCHLTGIDYEGLEKPGRYNQSLAVEQMLLYEKIQKHLYSEQNNIFKKHLKVIHTIPPNKPTKPVLKSGIADIIAQNHQQDLLWLKQEQSVDLLSPRMINGIDSGVVPPCVPAAPSVRDIFQVEESAAVHYEAYFLDEALKQLSAFLSSQ